MSPTMSDSRAQSAPVCSRSEVSELASRRPDEDDAGLLQSAADPIFTMIEIVFVPEVNSDSPHQVLT